MCVSATIVLLTPQTIVADIHFEQLSYLVSPLVNDWHVDVVNEAGHLATGGRPVRRTHSFVHVTLNGVL